MRSPPSALFLLSGIGMMAVAVVAVLFWRRRGSLWRAVGWGALAWVVAVALKFAWGLPTNAFIQRHLTQALPESIAVPVFWIYVGLLTGIFECGLTLVFVKCTRAKAAGWNDAVAFGIGFGAIEAFLLGLLSFVSIAVSIAFWDQFPADAKDAAAAETALGVAVIPLPIVERLSALAAHVFTCVLIVYGVRVGAQRWFWLSFVYKSALDAFAAWGLLAAHITKSALRMAAFEAAVGVFAIVAVIGLIRLHRRFGNLPETATDARASP